MKTKISALPPARHLIFGVVFSLCLTACGLFDWSIPTEIHVYSLKDAEEKLASFSFGTCGLSPDSLLDVFVKFDLEDLSQPDNNYLRLIEIIGDSGLYVNLILPAEMGGKTVFTSPPLDNAAKGMDKIVGISLPLVTTSIMTDINGMSPFYFYENLKRVESDEKFAYIGDFAFSSCKSLEQINLYSVKIVGRDAFRGCENLIHVGLSTVETIEERAFFDCNSLERISMYRKPPILGDSAFLGSTPDTFTFSIDRVYHGAYRTWIEENASKFNNNGEDIIFHLSY